MKRTLIVLGIVMLLIVALTVPAVAVPPPDKERCTTIQSGEIFGSSGVITTGYNDVGYNYQAHMFNGPWDGDDLVMKWNSAWLSNVDCDGDGLLDRHDGFPSYDDSGAWLTNHWVGEYQDGEGNTIKWTYFIKIVAVPSDAEKIDDVWYAADGTEIGPDIWGQFAIVQVIDNDPGTGAHGLSDKSPMGPGFGQF